jgi:pimeloyl-ACP methyl ester carboxylesterase
VTFAALDGTPLEGWLVRPHRVGSPPLVIMAPGLTGTKEGLLEPFAWRFAREGVAVLMFDYRCFGGSCGLPRHWVDVSRHQQDYEAALRFARETLAADGSVDSTRIALWGSSFSGGTVLMTAAKDEQVRAVIAQCPFVEMSDELEPRGLSMARYVLASVLDLMPFLPPVYIPVFGKPGEWVFAPSHENPSVKGFDEAQGCQFWQALPKPLRGGWENRMLARMLSTFDELVPMQALPSLRAPLLLIAAEHDDLIALSSVKKAHTVAGTERKELATFPCGHFGLYIGPESDRNRELQASFLRAQLAVTAPDARQHGVDDVVPSLRVCP